MEGKVVRIFSDKGFGFIKTGDAKDTFFHLSSLRPPLQFDDVYVGMTVCFETEQSDKGVKAINMAEA